MFLKQYYISCLLLVVVLRINIAEATGTTVSNPEESAVTLYNTTIKFYTDEDTKSTVTEENTTIDSSKNEFSESTVTEENNAITDEFAESTVTEENNTITDESAESTVTEENNTITDESAKSSANEENTTKTFSTEETHESTVTEEYTTTETNADVHLQNICEDSQKCYGKCCALNEKCSDDVSKCIALVPRKDAGNFFDLFDFNESDITTSTNDPNGDHLKKACPPQRQCLENCCSSHEVCNKENKCVNENPGSILDLFDFNDSAIIIPIYEEKLKCPNDQQLCQDKCCSSQETCSDNWKCIPIMETLSSKINKSAIVYTSIGLGCLVAALAFVLFKVYNFKRAQRSLF